MKISTSFLSSSNIPKDLVKLNETDTDYIHVDIMDGNFVKKKTMPFKEMRNIYKYTSKRLDVHLMVKNPKKYIKDYASLNTEYITFHIETDDVLKNLELIKKYGIKCGLAIKPNTEIKELVPYLPLLDLVLIMSVEPGEGGQKFMDDAENKINELKVLLKEYKSKALINVDGGINKDTKDKCKNADILVVGSYVVLSDDFQKRIDEVR